MKKDFREDTFNFEMRNRSLSSVIGENSIINPMKKPIPK